MYELINGNYMQVKEYEGQRVVTFKDIDTVHGRPEGTAKRNFNQNLERFIEGLDFYRVCADEIRTHKIIDLSPKAHEDIILLTETGYLMLVKSFTDDLAWTVQRELVNTYFRVRQQLQSVGVDVSLMEQRIAQLETAVEMLTEEQRNRKLSFKLRDGKFLNYEGFTIRAMNWKGSTWFVMHDVCRAIGYTSNGARLASKRLDSSMIDRIQIPHGFAYIISKDGVESLVLTSNKRRAIPFWEWLQSETD